jgi:PleD family two-component response regulator
VAVSQYSEMSVSIRSSLIGERGSVHWAKRSAIQASWPTGESVTVSVGVTRSQDADDVDSLLVRADKALYQAKEGGPNRFSHA